MVESMSCGGVVTQTQTRDSFNIDKLDGNGLSKVVLDPRNTVDSFRGYEFLLSTINMQNGKWKTLFRHRCIWRQSTLETNNLPISVTLEADDEQRVRLSTSLVGNMVAAAVEPTVVPARRRKHLTNPASGTSTRCSASDVKQVWCPPQVHSKHH
jgi:hypothetical protein